jgi:hypothetical protein
MISHYHNFLLKGSHQQITYGDLLKDTNNYSRCYTYITIQCHLIAYKFEEKEPTVNLISSNIFSAKANFIIKKGTGERIRNRT